VSSSQHENINSHKKQGGKAKDPEHPGFIWIDRRGRDPARFKAVMPAYGVKVKGGFVPEMYFTPNIGVFFVDPVMCGVRVFRRF
jgi:hypothetical protein